MTQWRGPRERAATKRLRHIKMVTFDCPLYFFMKTSKDLILVSLFAF